jgi:flagellar biosynthesis/type III secretory pathway protein FliH
MMIVIMTAKKLKKICDDYYERGVAKGYEFGYKTAKGEKTNRGFILGSRVDEQLKEILRKSEFGKG